MEGTKIEAHLKANGTSSYQITQKLLAELAKNPNAFLDNQGEESDLIKKLLDEPNSLLTASHMDFLNSKGGGITKQDLAQLLVENDDFSDEDLTEDDAYDIEDIEDDTSFNSYNLEIMTSQNLSQQDRQWQSKQFCMNLDALFRAIYDDDEDEWIEEITGLIKADLEKEIDRSKIIDCMKNSIQRYLIWKRNELHDLIKTYLTVVDNQNNLSPKPVQDAVPYYKWFMEQLIATYWITDQSVDQLVEVWESLVKFQGNLWENMSIWHFDHLTKEIWHEHNIMIII